MSDKLQKDFNEALRLLWFWLPEHEPDPHSKNKAVIERNKRWRMACKLYQDNVVVLPPMDEVRDE